MYQVIFSTEQIPLVCSADCWNIILISNLKLFLIECCEALHKNDRINAPDRLSDLECSYL